MISNESNCKLKPENFSPHSYWSDHVNNLKTLVLLRDTCYYVLHVEIEIHFSLRHTEGLISTGVINKHS